MLLFTIIQLLVEDQDDDGKAGDGVDKDVGKGLLDAECGGEFLQLTLQWSSAEVTEQLSVATGLCAPQDEERL